MGFEPTAEFNPSTHLAGEPNRPLWHLPEIEVVAEEVGFEPTLGCPKPVFKTGAIGRSATPPLHLVVSRKILPHLLDSAKKSPRLFAAKSVEILNRKYYFNIYYENIKLLYMSIFMIICFGFIYFSKTHICHTKSISFLCDLYGENHRLLQSALVRGTFQAFHYH